MKRYLPYVGLGVILLLTAYSGYLHGSYSNRWGPPADMQKAVERFNLIPKAFGDWRLEKPHELEKDVVDMLQCEGSLYATYVNQTTGDAVVAFVILGPPGPTAVHTPEVCYSVRDTKILEDRTKVEFPETGDEFWALTLQSKGINREFIRVYYAWAFENNWTAPEWNPRWDYGGKPWLFKMQLATHAPPDTEFAKHDPCKEFLKALLPELDPTLLKPVED